MSKKETKKEKCKEWISSQHKNVYTNTQKKYISKIKKLAEKYPKKVKVKFNKDGTICAKLPLKALKLSIIERELSEEQRKEMSRKFKERMYKED